MQEEQQEISKNPGTEIIMNNEARAQLKGVTKDGKAFSFSISNIQTKQQLLGYAGMFVISFKIDGEKPTFNEAAQAALKEKFSADDRRVEVTENSVELINLGTPFDDKTIGAIKEMFQQQCGVSQESIEDIDFVIKNAQSVAISPTMTRNYDGPGIGFR